MVVGKGNIVLKDLIKKEFERLRENAFMPGAKREVVKLAIDFYTKHRAIIEEQRIKVKVDYSKDLTEKEVIFLDSRVDGCSLRESLSNANMSYTEYLNSSKRGVFIDKSKEIDQLKVDLAEDDILEGQKYSRSASISMDYMKAAKPQKWSQQERIEELRNKLAAGDHLSTKDVLDSLFEKSEKKDVPKKRG